MVGLATLAAAGLLVSPARSAPTEPGGEFHYPSPSQVPAPSAYNTTPACPTSSHNGYECEFSSSALPLSDANNPERYMALLHWV